MAKITFNSYTFPIPYPIVVVVAGWEKPNPSTYIYFGEFNQDPIIIGIGIRERRYTYKLMKETGEFTVNFVNRKILRDADLAGMVSGRNVDKTRLCKFTYVPSQKIRTPIIEEAPVNLEVKIYDEIKFTDHNLILGKVENVLVSSEYVKEGKVDFKSIDYVVTDYNSISYYSLGPFIARWGFSREEK